MNATTAAVLLMIVCSTAHTLYFEHGFDHHYTYSSESDILGMHNVTTVIKFRIRPVNASSAEEKLHLLMVDSFVQHSDKNGYVMDNPMQWNFDLKFFFTVGTDGLVTLVHYHPDEIHEVLTIKKVIASALSTRVQLGDGDNWSFTSHEDDHTGRFEHAYKGLRHPDGVRFVRSHNSTTDVHRMHSKTIEIDNTGTLVQVDAMDNITLRHSPSQKSRMSIEGIKDIEEDQTGEFPKIASVSRSKVKLTIKQKHDENSSHTLDEMRIDSLIVKQKNTEKRSLNEIAAEIQKQLKCTQKFANKFEVNRTSCVSKLKALIRLLNAEDLRELGRSVLSKQCNPANDVCIDERNLFIDIIGHQESHEAQRLLLEYVLRNPNVTEGDLQRCLFHAVAYSSPHPEFVKHVEGLCFGDGERTPIGAVTALSNTEKRACLSLGAMAKSLHVINETESDRIVERIENWLGHHDEENSMAIIKPRRRRAINERNVSEGKHIETKMILIQSLGNAGKARSLQHIKSYMQPNMGVTVWRRAGIHSLRHFSCNESAHALLTSAVEDDDNIVKKTAFNVLKKHPKSNSFTDEHENMILSKSYTYQNVVRVRRSLLETLEKGISVTLQSPSIEWEHTLGTKDIGASFGLHIQNVLDLKLALLTGHFKVDVYDEAHAEAHVGMVGLHVDIIKAHICFKGHIQYNLNVLKDFGIDSLSDLATVFDSILKNITTPINKAVDGFKAIIEAFKGRSIQKIVEGVVNAIQNLPTILGDVTQRLQEFVREIFSITSSVIMEEIKVIVQFIRHFVDGVKSDILKFYNDLVDSVTMALPYITAKIKEAFKSAVEAFRQLFNNPLQAITAMSRAISDIKMAVTMVVDVKSKVLQVCNVFKGRSVEWIATAKEVPKVIKRLTEAFKKLADSTNRHRRDLESDMMKVYSDGVDQMNSSTRSLENDLLAKWNEILKPLQPLLDLVQLFSNEFHALMEIITSLKESYLRLKGAFQHGKFMIHKLFGPKFHKSFPTERRPAKGDCTAGVWNTTTQGIYKTQGVDIIPGEGQSIVMPFTGIIHVQHEKQRVRIKPVDEALKPIEIVIENIDTPSKYNNCRLSAGVKIGKAGKETRCAPSFIHVSVRDRKKTVDDDTKYNYTDPSPFLDRMIPIPKWIRDCNDHEFRYIGQTFEAGESTESDYLEKLTEKIKRDRSQTADFSELSDPSYSLPADNINDPTSFKDSLMESIREETNKFVEFFKTALFGDDGPEVPNILNIVNVNMHNVNWLLEHLMGNTSLYKDIHQIIERLSNCTAAIPIGNPAAMALSFINKKIQQHGLPVTFGDVGKVTDGLMTMAEKVCPLFKGTIAMGFGHVCTVHDECMGITCSIPIPKTSRVEYITISVSVNLKDQMIELEINGSRQYLKTDGIDTKIDFEVKIFGMKLAVIANGHFIRGSFILSAEVKICAKLFSTCLPPIEIFHRITFAPGTSRHKRAIPEIIQPLIHELSIPKFMEQLGECHLLGQDVTKVLDDVRGSVVKQLLSQAVDKLGEIVTEFKDKMDFCVRANIPVPPIDIEIFTINTVFMVGPVPLRLEFGASGILQFRVGVGLCVLRMSTNVTLTPKIGAHVWGEAAVDIGFAYGGIRLDGYLLETKFPMTTEMEFSKYPIRVGARMDMELTPLRLKLSAFAKLQLIFVTVTVWEGTIWEYSVPKITKNIFHKIKEDVDSSPPQIMPQSIEASPPAANVTKRSLRDSDPTGHSSALNRGCAVLQIAGRPYYDPAFSLELHAEDEVSQVKLFYAVGAHAGGTNVVEWTDMGGSSLFAPKQLPAGIPLYWTVKAKNSQGLEAVTQCSLDTYDSTLPDGRVEHPYRFSSHPSKLIASVVVLDDSPLVETHYKAVGFSPGEFGSQFVDWQYLRLDHSSAREGVAGALRFFTVPRDGKLVAFVLKSQKSPSPEKCAQTCRDFGANCVSFDFDHVTEICELHDTLEGTNAYIHISGTFKNYERLDTGYNAQINYDNLPLKHGVTYFVNVKIKNVLGYDAYLVGEGTMVDFTSPEPGRIRNSRQDSVRADNCSASVSQKNCIDVTWQPNHRVIVDGPGSGTVFNGHEPATDELYTLTNHFVSANWKGFHDDETGISGYTWAVGRSVCGSDVVPFEDPYAHLSSKQFWTDSALHKDIHLEDGSYFITVQALNGAELGGALVTTVCHSTPFIVDTTPPVLVGITDIIYDEDFDLIAIYYNASDDLSKIADVEFGLGETKYDVKIKPYSLRASMDRSDPFIAVEDLGLKEGIPAWIRIRVTNNVALFTTGHGPEPILIDKTPPLPGNVLDGNQMHQDKTYQSNAHTMCAQWVDFFDPESGIDKFMWGVGSNQGNDDIVQFHNLTRYTKSSCALATLEHNHTYYSTVFVYNNALNSKSANRSSDGVLVDITPPSAGTVFDGKTNKDLKYSSETVSKYSNWHGFSDLESGIKTYKVDVLINEFNYSFNVGPQTWFEDHTISMKHNDHVSFIVHGINGADLEAAANSDGYIIDLTPPVLVEMSDNGQGSLFQSNNAHLQLSWHFIDVESGIEEYQIVIYETKYGMKNKFWPITERYNTSKPISLFPSKTTVLLDNLAMTNGALYTLHVTAINSALLATSRETSGITIDTSPPSTPTVRIGFPKDEENLNENNDVLHDDQNGIRVNWFGIDNESGITKFLVAVGTTNDSTSILNLTDFGKETQAYIQNIYFEPTSKSKVKYVVSVKAINGAGLESAIGKSKNIFVQEADVPGIVFDGRHLYQDEEYTSDHTSIAASFYGFDSASCNIIGYEWAIGTDAYGTDVLSYTNYGLVMNNDSHGQCQIHTELFEDTTYFITVRAITGCDNKYILSSSDGITLDRKPPDVTYEHEIGNDIAFHQDMLYQATADILHIKANVSDKNSIASFKLALGSLPLLDNFHAFTDDLKSLQSISTLGPGKTVFITAYTSDKAGNSNLTSSTAIIADITPPQIQNLECSKYMSVRKSLLTCSWETLIEYESIIKSISISLGSDSHVTDILEPYIIPKGFNSFLRDLSKHIATMRNMTSVIVNVVIENILGQRTFYGRTVVVDRTAPKVERLEVVTTVGKETAKAHQKCQLPRTFAKLQLIDAIDEESDIDTKRHEVAIGYQPYGTEILNYVPTVQDSNGTFFVDGFVLQPGTVFYASLRIYNKAGLKIDITTDSVVISQVPYLEVFDGDHDYNDIDYQSVSNIIQGYWRYSDLCPIKEASWSVQDLTGRILFQNLPIPNAGSDFYNDEVSLENGMKYIVTVRTVDFIDRVKIGRSDGFSVRIQPPVPGIVRDGTNEDQNYQVMTTELSANWDSFGDNSNDPTQVIHHYEVAIGNDRRYANTRSNVHYFVNVGLNRSYTFVNMNLTSKLVRYYITVRAYSIASGFAESYSNGIRVGYEVVIVPGTISLNKYQSTCSSIDVSWGGFTSDIEIIDYKIAVSSHDQLISNDTLKCTYFFQNASLYDISNLHSVGQNTYTQVKDLNLFHGHMYYVLVVAEDEAGMCTGVISEPVLIDVTAPQVGTIFINGLVSNTVVFARTRTEIHIEWSDFRDEESSIIQTSIVLYECSVCLSANEIPTDNDCAQVSENIVKDDVRTSFYELTLNTKNMYYVTVAVLNGARNAARKQSLTILLDSSNPLSGDVKITNDWSSVHMYQHSTSEITGLLAIADTYDDYMCLSVSNLLLEGTNKKWTTLREHFSNDYIVVNQTGTFLGIGYNSDLTDITKSAVVSDKLTLEQGNYSFSLTAAKGLNIVTTAAIFTSYEAIPFRLINKPIEQSFDDNRFSNVTGLTSTDNKTSTFTESSNISITNVSDINASNISKPLDIEEYGFGIHLLGYTIETNIHWHHVFWARNKYTFTERWFQLNFDPSIGNHKYTIQVEKRMEYLEVSLDLKLIVEGKEIVSISGFKFNGEMNIAAMTWNENHYKPPLVDIYRPFYSEAIVSQTQIPDNRKKLCRHGLGFHDGESGIKEILVGVSDSVNKLGNISPVKHFKSFCFQCRRQCEKLCKAPCEDARLSDGFTLVPIHVSGLSLTPTGLSGSCHGSADPNSTNNVACNSTAYYLNVKVVNYAGEETIAYSNAVQIDLTPPACEYVKCVDPAYNEDEPTNYIGSRSMIGAYWNCSEDTSQIEYYLVRVVTANGSTIMNNTNVGRVSRAKFVLANYPFEDRKNYTLELSVMNTAGLSVNASCSVHVSLYPPDIMGISAEPLHTEVVSSQSENQDIYWTSSQTSVGITWQGGSTESEFYEWKIGTRKEADDILPPMTVGMDSAGSAEVDQGKLKLNNTHINRTVGQFRKTINMSTEQVQNWLAVDEREKSFFYIEPGRCMHQSLHAIGYSHLKSKARRTTVCVKRADDIFLSANVSEMVASKLIKAMKWEPGLVTSPEIIVNAKLLSGGVTLGTLMNNDKTSQYGTAASAEYKPFIADFTTTRDQTSRLLRHRIKKACDLSFYLAPAPFAEYNSVDIHVTIPAVCPNDPDNQPALIYWDADQRIWVHIDEGCKDYLTAETNNGVYTAKLCHMNEFLHDTKRSAASTFESPKAFEVVSISNIFHNSPPKIITETLHFVEDTVVLAKVETVDDDKDDLLYEIVQQPLHMQCQIDDVAQLNCSLEENFYGIDFITIRATEVHLPVNENSKTAVKKILMNVKAVPDKTDRYFVDMNKYVHTVNRPTLEHTIKVDANTSNTLFAGRILLADVDGEETFTGQPRFTPLENSTYTLSEAEVPLSFLKNVTPATYRSMKAFDVNVNFSPKAKGKMTLDFIATTSDGSYTPGVSLSIYVLENPCVFGHCSHEALGDAGCNTTKRAESFAGFYCVCDAGYTEKWCQTDIDECKGEPCSLMHDCKDLVDEYNCKINVPKLVAALIGSVIGICLVVFIIVKLVKKYRSNKVGQSRVNLMETSIYRSNHVPADDDETDEIKFSADDVLDNTFSLIEISERVSKIRFNPEWCQPRESHFSSTTSFDPIIQQSKHNYVNPIIRPATSSTYNGTNSRWLEDIPKSGMRDTEKLTAPTLEYDVLPQSHTLRTFSPSPLDTLCEELRKGQQSQISGQVTDVDI